MLPEYLISILKFVLVGIILVGMIVILLGINHLTHNDDTLTPDETAVFKNEVSKGKRVISKHSVFNNFLARSMRRGIKNN